MNFQRINAIRTAVVRPALRQQQIRLQSTGPQGPHVGDKGTAKVYNKDGTNPNKNFVYLGAGVVGLGAAYFMFGGRSKSLENSPSAKAA